MKTNVLITSISKKVPLLKVVKQAVSRVTSEAIIIGADSHMSCIGSYFVDQFWHMPRLDELNITELIAYCERYNIGMIVPTRDGELLYFAKHRISLAERGIHVMISDEQAVTACLDKLRFFEELHTYQYPVIQTTLSIDTISATRYVVKERHGAGSHNIGLNLNKEEAINQANKLSIPVFQPFIEGKEFSVDMYIDRDRTMKGVIVRQRELIVQGESQISTTVQHPMIEGVCMRVAQTLQLYGHIIFQVIEDKRGSIHIIECNPRFGGASTLSIAAGLDSFFWCYLEARGEELAAYPFCRSETEKRLVRHTNDWIIDV
ncbi:ATP-grasp domain-containing protein [Aneurinibacillus migulanus]|uniref:Carbamoyl-phosphate synthase large subunit n=1 Tax=Aneurinibacillus migulanus TaxID=47500 RepID=A0A1G8KXS8_ANEMI|nr:ATP-grasp domain-containing protein [Aneurinibacillus migulanus]MED0892668.1 ATP-grasp domain-containing protein [Aneurinibacillus migulanus]MED1614309.1 ATP-grasp domain-containing protein [Aneurinibacillus migulanus]GED14530.1 carbamoyl phosphate synthase [Aneurinibacillus migulanus]SDI48189.1 carbamoyl-phosphate synthase large subunit [Aneurinibacillus migulanus]